MTIKEMKPLSRSTMGYFRQIRSIYISPYMRWLKLAHRKWEQPLMAFVRNSSLSPWSKKVHRSYQTTFWSATGAEIWKQKSTRWNSNYQNTVAYCSCLRDNHLQGSRTHHEQNRRRSSITTWNLAGGIDICASQSG